jgi:SAM-dependent methyltransferase
VADAIFEDPRLAAVYDDLDPDRRDLEAYLALVAELGAADVLDIGCGTGVLALLLAERGVAVTGVDPAAASLAVARAKPGAERVRWRHGDATGLPPMQVDLATMTGNVAQAIVDPAAWSATLRGIRAALRPGGHLVFETRDPARRAWRGWTRADTHRRVEIAGVGGVESWSELRGVDGPLVTFSTFCVFVADGAVLESSSTLRFRERDEVEADLHGAGFEVVDVRDAPDRPGLEFVFVARPLPVS